MHHQALEQSAFVAKEHLVVIGFIETFIFLMLIG
jgi:hypothetical protein